MKVLNSFLAKVFSFLGIVIRIFFHTKNPLISIMFAFMILQAQSVSGMDQAVLQRFPEQFS